MTEPPLTSSQSVFKDLPDKLQKKQNRPHAAPATTGKKRASQVMGANGSHLPTSGPAQSPKESMSLPRARTLPMEVLSRASKRNSIPDPLAVSYSLPTASGLMNPLVNLFDLSSLSSPAGDSPTTPQPGLAPPVSGPNMPDIKAMMFPSDDPFAYPNQPISTLEDANYITAEQAPSSQPRSRSHGTGEEDLFGLSGPSDSAQIPQDFVFDPLNMSIFHTRGMTPQFPQDPPQQSSQPGRHFAGMMDADPNFGLAHMEGSSPMNTFQLPHEGYWHQMQSSGRTGLTPGEPNLDELLFGAEGWGGPWNEQNFPKS